MSVAIKRSCRRIINGRIVYEHATLMGIVHALAESEAARDRYDERMARPRGRLRAPQVLSPKDEETLRDLR